VRVSKAFKANKGSFQTDSMRKLSTSKAEVSVKFPSMNIIRQETKNGDFSFKLQKAKTKSTDRTLKQNEATLSNQRTEKGGIKNAQCRN
jgi:hypothetical protein